MVRGVAVLITPWRPVFYFPLGLFVKYSSTARLTNSAIGAPVFALSTLNFFIWSGRR